ncbi:hypothetical protein [Tengunoibacter tsumagoiensis]|uniref:Nif11 domain-containing protein n=1 Tax=Tengunoibacter tsumagoiensis TaxID=2014871 RepID=A0A402A671_9CHLR|nr:hypothetical protein [Tengunoibacter tsumagoiensis]GCE14647.1 hypothetical protein KTT_45060 [Tengunoibacter tsumagoiensis]
MSDQNNQQLRALARQLSERMKTEPDFKAQVEKDPSATLTAAGLPTDAVKEFLQLTSTDDVTGYSADTIWISICILSGL